MISWRPAICAGKCLLTIEERLTRAQNARQAKRFFQLPYGEIAQLVNAVVDRLQAFVKSGSLFRCFRFLQRNRSFGFTSMKTNNICFLL